MAIRTFVGLPMPEEYKVLAGRIRDRWCRRLRSRLTWTRPVNWHLTLKFLGDTDEDLVPGLIEALGGVSAPRFDFKAGGGGFFPGSRRPRVVWIGMEVGGEACAALASAVEEAVFPLGFEPEARDFKVHLTLARVRENASGDPWDTLKAELDVMAWPSARFEKLVLWRSDLAPSGPTYTPLAEFPAVAGN